MTRDSHGEKVPPPQDSAPEGGQDDLVQMITAEVARLRAVYGIGLPGGADGQSSVAQPDPSRNPAALTRLPEPPPPIASKSEYALSDFLNFQDEDFVRNVYRGVLKREPDAPGVDFYLRRLRDGELAKIEVLEKIRFSSEGRSVGVPVRGLAVRVAVRRMLRIPVIGRVAGILLYLLGLPELARHHERLEAALAAQHSDARSRIDEFHATVGALEGNLAARFASTQSRVSALESESALRADVDARLSMVNQAVDRERRTGEALSDQAGRLEQRVDALAGRLEWFALSETVDARFAAMQAALGLKADRAQIEATVRDTSESIRTLRASLLEQIAATDADRATIQQQVLEQQRALDEQRRRLANILDKISRRLEAPRSMGGMRHVVAEGEHLLDSFYVAFEDRFRGSWDDIKERVAVYLPLIAEAKAGTVEAPVVDIGCGRGEWLELLKETRLVARGVDTNRQAVDLCRERGLDVVEGDAIDYLQSLPTGSLGAITGLHVIEHIPFTRLVVLFDEAVRVLRPGGIVAFETPNPENLLVGACTFYCDPTHQRPLPPEPMRFVAEARGFTDVRIMRLHPYPASARVQDAQSPLHDLINGLLYGPQDYVVIGRKA